MEENTLKRGPEKRCIEAAYQYARAGQIIA
jgi:hypothetical protein